MSTAQQTIRRSALINRRAIDRQTVEDIGRIEQVWLDPLSDRVVGFTCKLGLLSNQKRWFTWTQIDTIGDHVLVNTNPGNPEVEQPVSVVTAIGHEVLTDAGNKAGTVVDFLFEGKTGAVISYLFQSSGWRGVINGIYVLPVTAISSRGSKRMIVAETAVAEPQQYVEGIGQRVGHATEVLKKDLDETLKHVEGVKQGAQHWAKNVEGVKQGAQKLAGEFQDKAQVVKEQAGAKWSQFQTARSQGKDLKEPIAEESLPETNEGSSPKDPEAE